MLDQKGLDFFLIFVFIDTWNEHIVGVKHFKSKIILH
jgi:hypothetical protein